LLVFTTLTKEALPMLRYRTGDVSSIEVMLMASGAVPRSEGKAVRVIDRRPR
jgi:phenylacetate-coenzyme A ligase PaaK-like adenylate-forming protein